MRLFPKKTIYLDYAAATPLRKEAKRAMEKYFSEEFCNPSAVYEQGMDTRRALEDARTRVARILHAGSKDIIFTSGGTESDNLAILGTFEQAKDAVDHPHIIVLADDHPAILEAAREAERRGALLSIVSAADVVSHITENTVLISLSLCNSETGQIVRAGRIGRAIREARRKNESEYPYLHLDASQAVVTQPVNIDTLQADLLTLDAGKIYGPKGVGALVVRPWAHLRPLLVGGGQERGLRSGTENIPGIIGFAESLSRLEAEREEMVPRFQALKARFIDLLQREVPEAIVNGRSAAAEEGETVPNIVSVTIPGKLHEFLAIALAERGVLVSTGSSCSSRKDEDDKEAIRFSFGRDTSQEDIENAVRNLKSVLL